MDAFVGRLHWRYRVPPGLALPALAPPADLLDSYAMAMQEVLGADAAVWVVRKVETGTVCAVRDIGKQAVQKRIGQRLAGSVIRSIAHHAHDPDQVVRFENQADYVVSFLADLLAARTSSRWYYGCFRKFDGLSLRDAVAKVLLDNAGHAAGILARLKQRGLLPRILKLLGAAAPALLSQLRRPERRGDAGESLTPLIRTARRLLVLTGFCRESALPDESLCQSWITAQQTPSPGWNDPRALAEAVLRICLILGARLTPARSFDGAAAVEAVEAISPAAETLDWLDWSWLRQKLAGNLPALASATAADAGSPTPSGGLIQFTPLQRDLLDLLDRMAREGSLIPGAEAAMPQKTLAILAAACERESRWIHSTMAVSVIEWWIHNVIDSRPGRPAERVASPAAGSPSHRLRALRRPLPEQREKPPDGESFGSAHAGLFLLIRTLKDIRFASSIGPEWRPRLLFALAQRWSGLTLPDAGLMFWCGFPMGSVPPDPGAVAGLDLSRLAIETAAVLRAQRLMPEPLEISAGDETAFMAGWILRAWARWVRGFEDSSAEFLLDTFLLRRGRLAVTPDAVTVTVDPMPLDVVVEMCGYLAPVDAGEWLGNRRLIFARGAT